MSQLARFMEDNCRLERWIGRMRLESLESCLCAVMTDEEGKTARIIQKPLKQFNSDLSTNLPIANWIHLDPVHLFDPQTFETLLHTSGWIWTFCPWHWSLLRPRSFMHRDVVHLAVCSYATGFLVTGSEDGHVGGTQRETQGFWVDIYWTTGGIWKKC